jgi:hypothetical protein
MTLSRQVAQHDLSGVAARRHGDSRARMAARTAQVNETEVRQSQFLENRRQIGKLKPECMAHPSESR